MRLRKFSGGIASARTARVIGSYVVLSLTGILGLPRLKLAKDVKSLSQPGSPPSLRSAADYSTARSRVIEAYGKLPLGFEVNQGQTDNTVKFLARGRGFALFLTSTETVLALKSGPGRGSPGVAVLRMKLAGANPASKVLGLDELLGKSNYIIGNDPTKWRTNIPNYRKIALQGVYPGIDLDYHGEQRQLEADFMVAPGANPEAIRLTFEGASRLRLGENGDLVVTLAEGELRLRSPLIYQEISGVRRTVAGGYRLRGKREVEFVVGTYDRAEPLVIDPVLSYSTYLGGNNIDVANGIAVDVTDSIFVVGSTTSVNFPTVHPLQALQGQDAFVSKISADGSTLLYSTFLGGENQDTGSAIAVDNFGNAYVTGTTLSPHFPVTIGVFDPECGTDGKCNQDPNSGRLTSDAFVTKLNPAGSALVYSGFLGGAGNERGFGIAVDVDGNAYVTGSSDFPTGFPIVNGFQPAFGGGLTDAFMTKISASGSSILYSTFLGGSLEDLGLAIAVDTNRNALVTGSTFSTNFPTTGGGFSTTFGGNGDAFVTKINSNAVGAASLVYSTYLGGSGRDQGNGIAVDTSGKAYVTGITTSTQFPTTSGVLQPNCALDTQGVCEGDAFVSKLDPSQAGAASLVYSTYLGGKNADSAAGIAVDTGGNAYVSGFTNSTDFPITPQIFQSTFGGGNGDAFVAKLNPTGTAPLVYSSFLGGSNTEDGRGIAVDISGNAFVTGQTCSTDFPTVRALQATAGGNCDAFVAKVAIAAGPGIGLTPSTLTFSAQAVGTTSPAQTITVVSNGDSALTISNITISGDFAQTNTCSGSFAVGSACTVNVTFTPTTTGTRTGTLSFSDNAINSPQSVNLNGNGITPVVSLSTTSLSFGNQLVGTSSSPQTVTLTNTGNAGTLTIIGIDASGDFAQNNNCGNSLAAGSSCTINVTFKPTASGIRNGSLTITDNAGNSPQVVSLTGHGTAPVVNISPTSLAFGNQGFTGPAQTVTLSNVGDGALTISAVAVGSGFSQTNNCGATVNPGASCTFNVTFTPTTPGPATGQLTITDNASGSPHIVNLSGTATIPVASLSVTSVAFVSQPLGTTSGVQTVKLSNTGNATLNIAGIAITGDFAQTNTCGSTLAGGASCAINVTFTPTTTGARDGTLAITDDAPGSPQKIALTGSGSDFSVSATPASAAIPAGQSTSFTITITPSFGFNATVNLNCDGAPSGSVCSVSPTSVTPDGTNPSRTTVTVSTIARTFLAPRSRPGVKLPPAGRPVLPAWFWLGLVFLILAVITARGRRRAWVGLIVTVLFVVLWAACAGGSRVDVPRGTPAGTFTLTVSAKSGALVHTATVNLTVN